MQIKRLRIDKHLCLVDFDIRFATVSGGSSTILIGENGAGKSTMIECPLIHRQLRSRSIIVIPLSTNMHRNQYLLSKVAMLTVLQRTILLLREVIGRFVRLPKRIPCFHSVLLRFIPERITNFFRI